MADWSKLPYELLGEIVMRLETIEDLVYFSVVYRLWNQLVSKVKHEFRVKTAPWLLLAENTEGNPDCIRKVFNPCNMKCYQLKLPEISGCRCWGSACGWMVAYNHDFELHMFNPLTKLRLPLPPRWSLPYKYLEESGGESEEGGNAYNSFICKAFVFEVAPDDFVVFLTYFSTGMKLAYARPGDQSWTSIEKPRRTVHDLIYNSVVDVVVHGGKILVLYWDGMVGSLDMRDLHNPDTFTVDDYRQLRLVVLSDQHNNLGLKVREYVPATQEMLHDVLYLVDSCGGIFIVLRRMGNEEDKEYKYVTLGFSVYQLQFDAKKWSQVYNLDDVALFVGNNSSMSILASKVSNCESNCIYFTDNAADVWISSGGKDMGVFELANAQLDDTYIRPDDRSKRQTPLCFMPRI